MSDNTTLPTHLEVSSHFLHDAWDFKMRYRHCALTDEAPSFMHIKSRRCKCFIDLRMGVEAVLKSVAAYHVLADYSGKKLVKKVEGYGHHVDRLWGHVREYLAGELVDTGSPFIDRLAELPVGLRYRFDAWDFEGGREALYGETVGSDVWMSGLYGFLDSMINAHNKQLATHSRMVTMADIKERLSEPEFRRYRE